MSRSQSKEGENTGKRGDYQVDKRNPSEDHAGDRQGPEDEDGLHGMNLKVLLSGSMMRKTPPLTHPSTWHGKEAAFS